MKRAITILLALLMVLSLAACGGGSTTTPTPEPTEAPTPEPTPEPTEEPMPEEINLQLNEAATVGGFEFTIKSVEFVDQYSTSAPNSSSSIGHKPKVGCFIRVDYFVKNVSKTKRYTPLSSLSIDYNDGYIYNAYKSYHSVSSTSSGVESFADMEPLSEGKSCRVYFDVPTEVRDTDNPLSVIITITEGNDDVYARYIIRSGDK